MNILMDIDVIWYLYVQVLSMNNYLCKRTCKPPETSKATTLQIVKLLLSCIFTGDHILYDGLYGIQNHMVMAG
jgi:hypothetical protein